MLRIGVMVALLMVAGCTQRVIQVTTAEDELVVPSRGTISSHDLIAMFAESCVRHFPDYERAAQAFINQGFVDGGSQVPGPMGSRALRRDADELEAYSGVSTVIVHDTGLPPFDLTSCDLKGRVSDPDNFSTEVLKIVDSSGQPLQWSIDNSEMDASFERNDTTLFLHAEAPHLITRQPGDGGPPEDCEGLPACQVWTAAELTVHLGGDPRFPG